MSFAAYEARELIEYLPEALFLEGPEGNILDVNKEACRLLGYSKEELLKQDVDRIALEDQPVFKPDRIEEATKSGEPIETINVRKDGTEVPVELRGRLLDMDEKKRVLVSVRNIEGRKKAEKELKKKEERYQKYFEKLGDAVFLTKMGGDDAGRIIDANSAAVKQTGYSREELVSMNIMDDLGPDEPERVSYDRVIEKLERGEMVSFTEKKISRDGSEYWTEVVVTPTEHEGIPATLSINRDITERKTYREKLRAVEELSQKIKLTKHRERIYDLVLDGIEEALGYGTYSICEKRGEIVEIVRIKGDYLESSMGREMPIDGNGLIPAACRKEEPIYVEDITNDERYVQGTPSPGSEFVVPLQVEGQLYGALDFESENKGAFNERDRDLMEILGSQIAVALQGIERLQLYDDQRDKLRKLHETVDRLQQEDTEKKLVQTAVGAAEEMLDFELSAIALAEGNYLVPKSNTTELDPSETEKFEIGEGIAGKTVQKGETIWGDDLRNFPEAKPSEESFRAFISAPIGEVGVLQIISEEVGSFDQRDVELAEILAGHLSEEVQRIRLEKELRRQAIRDPLTGLYNRRYFNETLKKEIEKAERHSRPVAFLMIDINNFKEVNDRYSHQTGDEVLKEVAGVLQDNVRGADTVVRYGGDEFLIMMPDTNGESDRVVSRLKDHLEEWSDNNEVLDYKLTLAMGSTHWSADQDRNVEEALEEADRRMYADKNG
jgi:diguanylate cyclase (GGDEF)-like protein/PAS domain S-box-containing protein